MTLKSQPFRSCCLTCCCTIFNCCGVKSEPVKPCSTIRGPSGVLITCAVTHLIIVPGGCPANKEASILPGTGIVAELCVVVTDAVDVAVVVVGLVFVVAADCASLSGEVCVVCKAKSINS